MPYNDADKGRIMGAGLAEPGPLLFGRRTYEDFFKVWAGRRDNPFSEVLDHTPKFVASTTLTEPLPWMNSTLLTGNVVDAVTRLKEQPGGDIAVMGSGELVRAMMQAGLVDRFVLLIHPLVLGSGRRLFAAEGTYAAFDLASAQTTSAGVIVATYRRKN
jgi:dihydrofolate reductase